MNRQPQAKSRDGFQSCNVIYWGKPKGPNKNPKGNLVVEGGRWSIRPDFQIRVNPFVLSSLWEGQILPVAEKTFNQDCLVGYEKGGEKGCVVQKRSKASGTDIWVNTTGFWQKALRTGSPEVFLESWGLFLQNLRKYINNQSEWAVTTQSFGAKTKVTVIGPGEDSVQVEIGNIRSSELGKMGKNFSPTSLETPAGIHPILVYKGDSIVFSSKIHISSYRQAQMRNLGFDSNQLKSIAYRTGADFGPLSGINLLKAQGQKGELKYQKNQLYNHWGIYAVVMFVFSFVWVLRRVWGLDK